MKDIREIESKKLADEDLDSVAGGTLIRYLCPKGHSLLIINSGGVCEGTCILCNETYKKEECIEQVLE